MGTLTYYLLNEHKKVYVTKQIKKIWVSVWNEVWLVVNLLTQILRK